MANAIGFGLVISIRSTKLSEMLGFCFGSFGGKPESNSSMANCPADICVVYGVAERS